MIGKLSIQSKLMLMLLSVCISSIMAIAYVGYNNGRQALYNSIQNQLVSLREVKAAEIENYFETVRSQVQTISEVGSVVEAVKELKVAYQELEDRSLQIAWNDQLKDFYNQEFLPNLEQNTEGKPLLYSYFPQMRDAICNINTLLLTQTLREKENFLIKPMMVAYIVKFTIELLPIYRNLIERFNYIDTLEREKKRSP